ncbi:MAG: S9 family peptidase [Actinomycetia bacterium]|nr:S9 family peptidase [Actinomycetes bacterium]
MSSTPIVAPVAEARPVERVLWGERVIDDFSWLRHRDDEAVVKHLEAENAYTDVVLSSVQDLQESLFSEIKNRIKEDDLSAPVSKDDWAYYSRTEEGLAYPIHCRRHLDRTAPGSDGASPRGTGSADNDRADEVILLDENVEGAAAEFFDVGPFDVSPDHRLLFWGWDVTGDERYTATVRDLSTGIDGQERLDDVSTASAWALDNRTLFYVRPDEAYRPFQVWRHRLGTDQSEDELVFTEPDERFFVSVGLERDESFIQIAVSSKVTDEVWVIPADQPMTEPRLVAERRQGVEYGVAHHGDRFIILTNDGGAENFKLVSVPDHDPGPENWEDLPVDDVEAANDVETSVMISDFDVSADHLILFERAHGATRIRVRRWSDGSVTEIDQPEAVSTVWPGANPEFTSTTLRYGYSSMVTPASLFTVDLETGERTLLKQQEVLGSFDPDEYVTERHWAEAEDGARIPISIVYRSDQSEGPRPCVLYAYGAYEMSMDPTFSSARLSLLDRGFSFAIAHVRGGGEMGRRWYLDGKFEHKHNTFDDVVACARHLVDEGVTTPAQLVLRGGSAGGLMAGAVVNQAPELFAAVVAQVAFVDALNTMLDPSLPLTVTEWEEWGNPAESESIYQAMRAYAPYENVHPADYPSVMATGGLNDSRVGYWEPAKWVQVLRRQTTGQEPILLWTDLGAGHGGPSGRYDAWREEARILTYILWALGLTT